VPHRPFERDWGLLTRNQLGLDGCQDLKMQGIFSLQVAKNQDGAHSTQPTYARVHSSELEEQRCLAQSVFHGALSQSKQLPHKVTAGEKTYWFPYRSELMDQSHKFSPLHHQRNLLMVITLVNVLGRQLVPGGDTILWPQNRSNVQSGFG